ncbi:MAG: UDP-N-acetylglucosamine 1-carboxyvinyltransferase, partial [Bacteroidales bacterium]|nr:UDP-N-acetylglucosamine 1-carboxyvinyltransferase [Bacteroidales bacterium]
MSSFEICGGKKLKGEIQPQGAKNEALQILCAVLLTPETVTIGNVPDIRDVNFLIDLLAEMGVEVKKQSTGTFTFKAANVDLEYLRTAEFKKKAASLRGSVMILGPLLSRFKKGYIPHPGGDKIGRRRLDTHFTGLQNLGAKFVFDENERLYKVEADDLKGCYMLLD